ncbi:aminopeptidase [Polaromonas jejuensis]|uniref:Aminopeptidase n=1 Tax=Polaromonas jejuensis TaxID=457502 RepID=A0ABW0Q9R3_9BURK|nr:aminopeptidase [Polaromonas jejuensis]
MALKGLRAALAAGLAAAGMAGCADLGYYWQSASGHLGMLYAARPVDDWLSDTQTPAQLKKRLALAQRIRRFAVTELKLPDNPSYNRYADLQRKAVVWNVVAAPELSLTLKTWCFPVAGCVGYRGYFNEDEALAEAERLKAEGWEVNMYGVPAYSTLGWMNWAGGDPLLNTFIGSPEGELARLIFHELAHQVIYVPGDTMFNESFATAVERMGSQRWLSREAHDDAHRAYARSEERRQQFRALTLATRRRLAGIYDLNWAEAPARAPQMAMKSIALSDFKQQYAQLKAAWGGYAGYDAWVAQANNASFGAQAAYDELVPGFEALFQREGQDWERFYDAVKRLAELPKKERHQQLKALAPHDEPQNQAQGNANG